MVFLIMLFKGLKELGIQPQLGGCRIPLFLKVAVMIRDWGVGRPTQSLQGLCLNSRQAR